MATDSAITRQPVTADLAGAAGGRARFVIGEAVGLDLQVARLGSRTLARMIDVVGQLVLFLVLYIVYLGISALGFMSELFTIPPGVSRGVSIITVVLVLVGYPVLLETLTSGKTLGKLILGLRVVRDDGGPIRFRQALTRGLVSAAIEWPGILAPPLTWLVCLWVMAVSPQGKRVGDHMAGTLVIHERTPAEWGWVPPMPPTLAGWAATLDLAGLDDDLALAVRHYLARNRQLREPARTQLGQRLAGEVAAATRPPAPPGTPCWAYLTAVHAERHRRAMNRLATVRARAAAVWTRP